MEAMKLPATSSEHLPEENPAVEKEKKVTTGPAPIDGAKNGSEGKIKMIVNESVVEKNPHATTEQDASEPSTLPVPWKMWAKRHFDKNPLEVLDPKEVEEEKEEATEPSPNLKTGLESPMKKLDIETKHEQAVITRRICVETNPEVTIGLLLHFCSKIGCISNTTKNERKGETVLLDVTFSDKVPVIPGIYDIGKDGHKISVTIPKEEKAVEAADQDDDGLPPADGGEDGGPSHTK